MSSDVPRKVMVSGCFDMLHSGHVAFLRKAASYGTLTVCLGSDETITALKGRPPIQSTRERRYMLEALRFVDQVCVGTGKGWLDFEPELRRFAPDLFIVNADGQRPEKEALCNELGIEYVVLDRVPDDRLPARSTTAQRDSARIPYRVDLAGGWLDQPEVSRQHTGSVVVASIKPTFVAEARSGMATSTRDTAIRLWGERLPTDDPHRTASILFACENPPGKSPVSGSQDSLGICLPGINRLSYSGDYWPSAIETGPPESIAWLEGLLYLLPTSARPKDYSPTTGSRIAKESVARLAATARQAWQAIVAQDLSGLAEAMSQSHAAQLELFPATRSGPVEDRIQALGDDVLAAKVVGAGGGGYILCLSEKPPAAEAIPLQLRSD